MTTCVQTTHRSGNRRDYRTFRWMYPQSEYNCNAKNVAAAVDREGNDDIREKPWWLQ